jgi:heme-degrading monooxygenase HmoA
MYATVRRYELGAGSRGAGTITELMRRCEEDLLPLVEQQDGFAGFYVVDAGNAVIVSVSIFESEAQAEAGNEVVKKFWKERLAGILQANPQVTEGGVPVHKP